jgi:hypothetical protein
VGWTDLLKISALDMVVDVAQLVHLCETPRAVTHHCHAPVGASFCREPASDV